MDTLDELKNYLRVDADITEDDALLTSLASAAQEYIESNTGKKFIAADPVMNLCQKLLVSHWYTNRSAVSKGAIQKYPHSLQDILKHIELSDRFKAVNDE